MSSLAKTTQKLNNCPRCSDPLASKKDIAFCAKHGVLLKAKQLEKMTSKSFSQLFWGKWFSLLQMGGVKCPSCLSRMIILNPATKKEVEIDCCPNCLAVWLDKNEGADLHLAFLTFEAEQLTEEKSKTVTELQALVGKEMAKLDARNQRYKKLAALGEELTRRLPWYRGN